MGDVDGRPGVLEIHGDLDGPGPRPAGGDVRSDAEHRLADLLGAPDGLRPAGQRAKHRELVFRFVEETLALAVVHGIDLARNHHHAAGSKAGFEEAGHGVGDAGAGTRYGNSELAGGARIPVGGVDGALFVADGDRRDAAPAVDSVIDRDVVHTDDAEDVLDAKGTQ